MIEDAPKAHLQSFIIMAAAFGGGHDYEFFFEAAFLNTGVFRNTFERVPQK